MLHAKIFRDIYRASKSSMSLPTQKELAERSGMVESVLSDFLLGKKDIKSSAFIKLISIMPDDFQEEYFFAFANNLEINIGTGTLLKKNNFVKRKIEIRN